MCTSQEAEMAWNFQVLWDNVYKASQNGGAMYALDKYDPMCLINVIMKELRQVFMLKSQLCQNCLWNFIVANMTCPDMCIHSHTQLLDCDFEN